MRRRSSAFVTPWPYATMLSCLYVLFGFADLQFRDWGWLILDALAVVWWFLIAHHCWERWSKE